MVTIAQAFAAKHGKLTVLKRLPNRGIEVMYECLCDCGNKAIVSGVNLGRGTNSCGCLRLIGYNKSHGKTGTTEYTIWKEMRNRCYNKNNQAYENYGGRGLIVCDRWQKFENFLEDMGERPSMLHSLDRINNDKNYSLDNCKWSNKKEQANNRRPQGRYKQLVKLLRIEGPAIENSFLSFGA